MPAERAVAVVTGANRGLGLEVARQLTGHGHTVVLTSRDLDKGRRALDHIDAPAGRALAYQLDVADPDSIAAMAERVQGELGRVDVLVNNAAIDYDTDQRAAGADLARVHGAMATNLFGAWRTTQALLALLSASAHPRVVNVSSEAGSITGMSGGTPAYSVSKAALNALTRLLAGELRDQGVLVNAVCPGWTATDMGGGGRPVEQGAAGIVWAALLPDGGPTGGFYRDGRPLPW